MTKAAITALAAIAVGDLHLVSWQMVRRLDAERLIDFNPRQGWHLTEYGWNSLPPRTFS